MAAHPTAVSRRARAAALAAAAVGLAGCLGPLGGDGVLTDVAWTAAGVVAVTRVADHPGRLWWSTSGKPFRPLTFEYCRPELLVSVFPLASGRVGLTVVCGEPAEVPLPAQHNGWSPAGSLRLVALEPSDGRVAPLAAMVTDPAGIRLSVENGVWSEPAGAAFFGYTNDCFGVGRLDSAGKVRPLDLEVPLPGGCVSLASDLPPAGGAGCAAHALARRLTISGNGESLAFFVHRCDGQCTGRSEFDGEWFVVVHDLLRQTVRVLPGSFSSPYAVALSDSGVVAVSARHGGEPGVWLCSDNADAGCRTPERLAKGTFFAAQFRADGSRLVAVDRDEREPVQIAVK